MTNRFAALLFLLPAALFAKDDQYTLTARPQKLDLTRATDTGVPIKNVSFDYDNAVPQQSHVLDLVKATTGNCPASRKVTNLKCDAKATFPT